MNCKWARHNLRSPVINPTRVTCICCESGDGVLLVTFLWQFQVPFIRDVIHSVSNGLDLKVGDNVTIHIQKNMWLLFVISIWRHKINRRINQKEYLWTKFKVGGLQLLFLDTAWLAGSGFWTAAGKTSKNFEHAASYFELLVFKFMVSWQRI